MIFFHLLTINRLLALTVSCAVLSVSCVLCNNQLSFAATGSQRVSKAISQLKNVNAQRCDSTVEAAQQRIKEGRTINTEYSYRKIDEEFEDYPNGRPDELWFRISGPAAVTVMQSPQFMNNISKEVISGCPTISSVVFNISRSDYTRTFGLLSGGSVGEFQCIFFDRNSPVIEASWGTRICL